jgi:parvulin-like peptidyl-prolyl isomerase
MPRMSTAQFLIAGNRLAALLVLCALGLCCVNGCSSSSMSQSNSDASAAGNQPVATVNGKIIPLKLYEMYFKNGRAALEIEPEREQGRRKLEQLREGIVSELIDRALIAEEVARRGLTIPPDQFANAERKTISDLGGEDRYNSYLLEHGFTRDEYREVIKSEIYGELLRTELKKGLSISDDEIKNYYEQHRTEAEFQQPERVTAAHILIAARPNLISQRLQTEKKLGGEALSSAVRAEMSNLRKRAEELRKKAANGADFAELARESSDDAGTRDRGGDLGTFARASHAKAFDDAAFALKPGQISAVVQSDFGFHVIKVSRHDALGVQTLEVAAPELGRRLLARLEGQKLNEWLKEARRKATVKISESYRFGGLKTEFP